MLHWGCWMHLWSKRGDWWIISRLASYIGRLDAGTCAGICTDGDGISCTNVSGIVSSRRCFIHC